ncbi:hypothetical protein ACXR0M_17225 [Pseudomonas sp. Eth.TT006]
MQEIETDIPPATTAPDTAQLHQAQLEDYQQLLSALREQSFTLAQLKQKLLQPKPFSPLHQEHQVGLSTLKRLLDDPDYQALCRSKNIDPNVLVVTLKDTRLVCEVSDIEGGGDSQLVLDSIAKWQELRAEIEKAVTTLGGQLRLDGQVAAPRMATFYGLSAWDPAESAQHQAAISAVEEKVANLQLGLEDDFDLFDLMPALTENDRQVSVQGGAFSDELQRQFITGEIKRVIQTFLPGGVTSPLTHLANDILSSNALEAIRPLPTVFLQKILNSPQARALGDLLLTTMKWYGGVAGEQSSERVRIQLTAQALRIWYATRIIQTPGIAGYSLQSRDNWGKSYRAIWRAFEEHLRRSGRAASDKEAIVMARLFLCEFPSDFRVKDIPQELTYKGSVEWINFVTGVNLVGFSDPQALDRKSFRTLKNLPFESHGRTEQEQLYGVSLAMLQPTLDWAISQALLPEQSADEYTYAQIEQALSKVDEYSKSLGEAVKKLNEATPTRLSIAQEIVTHDLAAITRHAANKDTFWDDHELASWTRYLNWAKRYSPAEVVADDNFDKAAPWAVIEKNTNRIMFYIWLDEQRKLHIGDTNSSRAYNTVCNARTLFETHFSRHIRSLTEAYELLIKNLLTSLSYTDRESLEFGKLTIHSLRKETYNIQAKHETPEKILPRRARNGLLLVSSHNATTRTFELLPRAGIIRRIDNLDPGLFGGQLKSATWSAGTQPYQVEVLSHKTLPFDWQAHATGSQPRPGSHCEAIIEPLGSTFLAPDTIETLQDPALTIDSKRTRDISHFIASELLFVDPKALRSAAYGETAFDREKTSRERAQNIGKLFVPFWKSVEDVRSDDIERNVNGAFGIGMELAVFSVPVGKMAGGMSNLLFNSRSLGTSARLAALATLSKEVSTLTLQALNPLGGIGLLLKSLGSRALRYIKSGLFTLKVMRRSAGHYDVARSLPQARDAGRWKPATSGDRLGTVRGIEDVPIRQTGTAAMPAFHAVDPLSGRPFGPRLLSSDVSVGRSFYRRIDTTHHEELYAVAKAARIKKALQQDGRTAVWIDDVAYRVQNHALRRVDSLDASQTLKRVPCRTRRVPNQPCIEKFANNDSPAVRPAMGSFSEHDSWAPWFGDGTFTASAATPTRPYRLLNYENTIYRARGNELHPYRGQPAAIGLNSLRPIARTTLNARLQFQEGIFAGLKVNGSAVGIDDVHEVGALIVYSKDGNHRYVFTCLNMNDYYMAKLAATDDLQQTLQMSKVSAQELLADTAARELRRIYIGSLNANNMVRIHGREQVHRALDTINEYAVTIGAPSRPWEELHWVRVTAYPASSLLFDGPTRATVVTLADGARTWSRSTETSTRLQRAIGDRFDALFARSSRASSRAQAIDQAMIDLQSLTGDSRQSLRNIAYADVVTATGAKQVYVSVSGAGDNTRHLPLFSSGRRKVVNQGDTSYFNVDGLRQRSAPEALSLANDEALLSIPHPVTHPARTDILERATSVDSESKLVAFIREKFPNQGDLRSANVVTTLPPCDSCSIIIKGFGQDRQIADLNVIWGQRPRQPR